MPDIVEISYYVRERLREDEEFILYRARASVGELPSVLLLIPASTRPTLETQKKIEHEYSLRAELESAWAARPLALSERGAQMSLVLEDPGGETLDGFVSGAMEMTQFWRRCRSRHGTQRVAQKEADSQRCEADQCFG